MTSSAFGALTSSKDNESDYGSDFGPDEGQLLDELLAGVASPSPRPASLSLGGIEDDEEPKAARVPVLLQPLPRPQTLGSNRPTKQAVLQQRQAKIQGRKDWSSFWTTRAQERSRAWKSQEARLSIETESDRSPPASSGVFPLRLSCDNAD